MYEKHCLFLSAGILAHRKRFLLHKCLLYLLIQFFSSFSGINGVFKTCSASVPQTLIHLLPSCLYAKELSDGTFRPTSFIGHVWTKVLGHLPTDSV